MFIFQVISEHIDGMGCNLRICTENIGHAKESEIYQSERSELKATSDRALCALFSSLVVDHFEGMLPLLLQMTFAEHGSCIYGQSFLGAARDLIDAAASESLVQERPWQTCRATPPDVLEAVHPLRTRSAAKRVGISRTDLKDALESLWGGRGQCIRQRIPREGGGGGVVLRCF